MLQDTAGNLWFATDAGISKYDGYVFQSFTSKEGIPDNSVLKLFLSPNGDIWFSTYNSKIGYIKSDTVYISSLSDTIEEYLHGGFVYNIHFVSEDTLWLTTNWGLPITIHKNKVDKARELPPEIYHVLKIFPKGENCYSYFEPINSDIERTQYELCVYSDSAELRYMRAISTTYFFNYQKINDTEYCISFNGKLYYIKNNRLEWKKEFDLLQPIVDLYFDDQQYLFVSHLSKGVDVYDIANPEKPIFTLFEDLSISKIYRDKEGSYWFSCLDKGVFFLPSMNFNIIGATYQKKILSLELFQDKIFYFRYLNGLYTCQEANFNNETTKIEPIEYWPLYTVYSILSIQNKFLAISGTYHSVYDGGLKPVSDYNVDYSTSFSISNDSNLLEAGLGYYKIYNDQFKVIFTSNENFSERVKSICEDKEGNIWLGTLHGLFLHTDTTPRYFGYVDPAYGHRISCIKKFGEGIVIGTTTSGMVIKNKDSIVLIGESDGLVSGYIRSLLVDGHIIWAGTNKGLSKISIDNTISFNFSIENYTMKNGLPANEIYDIKKNDQYLFLASEKGIVYFDPRQTVSNTPCPKTIVERIIVNNTDTLSGNSISLASNEDNLTIYFKGISYKNHNDLQYKYRLSGYENDWVLTKNTNTRYPGIPSGKFVFEVKATVNSTDYGPVASIDIFKEKQFAEAWYFWVAVILLFITLTVLVAWLIIGYNRKKEQTQRAILMAEQKALRLQMNPHFIFNSLGSIQRFILENESFIASEYLTDFARLMRLILESSRHSLIPLEDEIKAINLYLKLENLRFNQSIEYSVNVNPELDLKLLHIPPMLIQPLIENSLWHGIMKNGGKGKIEVTFSRHSNRLLLCEIVDNGAGFEKAKKIPRTNPDHKSTGLINITERISLLSDMFNAKMDMEIIDLGNDPKYDSGTRVKLLLFCSSEAQ